MHTMVSSRVKQTYSTLAGRSRRVARTSASFWRSRTGRLQVPEQPHFDDGGLACFAATVATSHVYMEYGCGGS